MLVLGGLGIALGAPGGRLASKMGHKDEKGGPMKDAPKELQEDPKRYGNLHLRLVRRHTGSPEKSDQISAGQL